MLSNINISNLENSFSKTSIYSDACENSFQVEQQYIKMKIILLTLIKVKN